MPSGEPTQLAPRVMLTAAQLDETVSRLAGELSARYRDGVLLVGVLRGGVLFLADLVRAMTVPVRVDFMAITRYSPGSGRVRLLKDLDSDIADVDVVLVEDIVDTGLSTAFLRRELQRRQPRSMAVCALLDRRVRRVVPVEIEYSGVSASEEYLIGYGLDHEGRYRNLGLVAAADPDALAADPDAYVGALYGPTTARRG